jgi:hypothetical protein
VENNVNSVKDVLVMYVHFIVAVITEYDKTKLEALLSYRPCSTDVLDKGRHRFVSNYSWFLQMTT